MYFCFEGSVAHIDSCGTHDSMVTHEFPKSDSMTPLMPKGHQKWYLRMSLRSSYAYIGISRICYSVYNLYGRQTAWLLKVHNCLLFKFYIMVLFRALAENCVDIARDRDGCCVLQSLILKADEHLRAQIVGEITQNALVLANDSYGNYVVQFVVGQKIKEATRSLVRNLKGQFETLSTNRFCCYLVVKFLKESDDEFVIKFIIDELVNKSNILMLLQDQYANIVIQSALDVAEEVSMFNLIVSVIKMHHQSLHNHPFGKEVVLHMNQLIRDKQGDQHDRQF
ncbi:hypothetical protein MKW94_012056 [Papaver nudicaule]|uniref:PUM-HD domain-containing protein n=1 Tax=Papaver nudicaule TaxID=74823 RepID=A0AA41V376_PAPNU|nr:hypothetical protein [Papaver nudicaule]